jgi:hypothetical protein
MSLHCYYRYCNHHDTRQPHKTQHMCPTENTAQLFILRLGPNLLITRTIKYSLHTLFTPTHSYSSITQTVHTNTQIQQHYTDCSHQHTVTAALHTLFTPTHSYSSITQTVHTNTQLQQAYTKAAKYISNIIYVLCINP